MLSNESTLQTLRRSAAFQVFVRDVTAKRVAGAYLILTSDKKTQQTLLDVLCCALYCESGDACLHCPPCLSVESGHRSDIYRFPLQSKERILTEDVEFILETAQKKPLVKGYQLFALRNADEMPPQAQNKLLKILEEPPESSVFLLGAIKAESLLKTVLSRVKILDFGAIESETPLFVNETLNIFQNLTSSKDVFKFLGSDAFKKDNFLAFLATAERFLHDMICAKKGKHDKMILTEIASETEKAANGYSLDAIANIEDALIEAYRKLKSNVSPLGVADNLLLRITEVKYLCR